MVETNYYADLLKKQQTFLLFTQQRKKKKKKKKLKNDHPRDKLKIIYKEINDDD